MAEEDDRFKKLELKGERVRKPEAPTAKKVREKYLKKLDQSTTIDSSIKRALEHGSKNSQKALRSMQTFLKVFAAIGGLLLILEVTGALPVVSRFLWYLFMVITPSGLIWLLTSSWSDEP